MAKTEQTNRFGNSAVTDIPDNVPMFSQPGHKLRTSNNIVDRSALSNDYQVIDTSQLAKLPGQKLQSISHDDQEGIIRLEAGSEHEQHVPNQFTGPSFRTQRERFRFDGHKMMHHLDRVQAWQNGQRFAPVHIDMGLTKFCNTACLYCYAVVQNMTKGTMIGREALLNFVRDCGKLGVRSLGFIGDGEPTLNPTLYDATVLAGELGIDTAMATNGILLDMDRAHDLLKNMSYIRFNLSAGTPEGFRRVHQSKEVNFHLLIDKIRELVKIKKSQQL